MCRTIPQLFVAFCIAAGGLSTAQAQATKGKPPGDAKPSAGDREKSGSSGEEATPAEEPVVTEKAVFGGGCFWCLEAVFERVEGVKNVVSGYAGGNVRRPAYENVLTGLTGHAEVVQIEFDPAVVTYEELLKVFWVCHDPTSLNAQGPDVGTQYRSIILVADETQRAEAMKSMADVDASGLLGSPIVTEIVPLRAFYPAEKYHQDYYRKHKSAPYCRANITPKLQALRQKFAKPAGESAKSERESTAPAKKSGHR